MTGRKIADEPPGGDGYGVEFFPFTDNHRNHDDGADELCDHNPLSDQVRAEKS